MYYVSIHTAVNGAYQELERLQLVGAIRFPERRGGPDDCIRELLAALDRSPRLTTVITAYADIINFLGELVDHGYASGEVHLHYPDGTCSTHTFSEGGYLVDWPFGSLSADHEEHVFAVASRLKNDV